jgi:hypothetical protein
MSAVGRRVGEGGDEIEVLEAGARPSVGEEQRNGSGPVSPSLYHVQVESVDGYPEVVEGVESVLESGDISKS